MAGKLKNYIGHHRGVIFDSATIFLSFSLGFLFPTLSDIIHAGVFSSWMLAALLLYGIGAAIKHQPLRYRLSRTGQVKDVPYVLFLIISHWFIILFVCLLTENAFRRLFRLRAMTAQDTISGTAIWVSVVVATFLTWLVYRSKTKRKKTERTLSSDYLFYIELLADFLLIAGIGILSFVFWDQGAMRLVGHAFIGSVGGVIFLFFFLAILFMVFYLPLRYLYFIEETKSSNGRRLLIVFAIVLVRALIEVVS